MSAVSEVLERVDEPRAVEPRPEPAVPLRRPGARPLRVLLYGGGTLAGWGLLDHERGLPGGLADRLAQTTGRGVDVDVVVELDPLDPVAIARLRNLRIARYDAVVAFPGEHQCLEHLGRASWAAQLGELVGTLRAEASPTSPVVVLDSIRAMVAVSRTGLSRMRLDAGAGRLAAVSRSVCDRSGVEFAELGSPTAVLDFGRQFTTRDYRTWAGSLAARLARLIEASEREPSAADAVRSAPQDERARQLAVDAMALSGLGRNGLLDGIAQQARKLFGGSVAAVQIVDGERVWQRASSRALLIDMPRALSFCDLTIRSDDRFLVPDTRVDPRFHGEIPAVHGEPVGFYVGEPIRSVDGYRIGALCVVDAEPREADGARFDQLHELAGRVERELWATRSAALRS